MEILNLKSRVSTLYDKKSKMKILKEIEKYNVFDKKLKDKLQDTIIKENKTKKIYSSIIKQKIIFNEFDNILFNLKSIEKDIQEILNSDFDTLKIS